LLNKEVNLAMADPKIKERIASLGGVALPGSPEDYGRTIAADTEKWAKVVQFSGALNRSCAPGRRVPHETRLKPFFAFDETIFPFPRLIPPSLG
jgi:hypothetical protein